MNDRRAKKTRRVDEALVEARTSLRMASRSLRDVGFERLEAEVNKIIDLIENMEEERKTGVDYE